MICKAAEKYNQRRLGVKLLDLETYPAWLFLLQCTHQSLAKTDEGTKQTILGFCQRIQRMGRCIELALLALQPSPKHCASENSGGRILFVTVLAVKVISCSVVETS